MPNVEKKLNDPTIPFGKDLDKITERETVYDFVSRLYLGKEFKLDDLNETLYPASTVSKKTYLKDTVLKDIIRSLDIKDIERIGEFKIFKFIMSTGSKTSKRTIPGATEIIRVVQESTGYDVTDLFTINRGTLSITVNELPNPKVPNVFKVYYI